MQLSSETLRKACWLTPQERGNTFCFLPTFWSCYIWSAVTDIFQEVYKKLEVNTYNYFDMVMKLTNAHKNLIRVSYIIL